MYFIENRNHFFKTTFHCLMAYIWAGFFFSVFFSSISLVISDNMVNPNFITSHFGNPKWILLSSIVIWTMIHGFAFIFIDRHCKTVNPAKHASEGYYPVLASYLITFLILSLSTAYLTKTYNFHAIASISLYFQVTFLLVVSTTINSTLFYIFFHSKLFQKTLDLCQNSYIVVKTNQYIYNLFSSSNQNHSIPTLNIIEKDFKIDGHNSKAEKKLEDLL